jgi:type VI protein secretion system component VasK
VRDGWIIYAIFGILVCLLLWRVATQWKVKSAQAENLRASLIILGVVALAFVVWQSVRLSDVGVTTATEDKTPPPRLRTHSTMLIQLLQSKVVSKSSSAMEQVRRWLSRSSKARQRTYSPPLTCSGWTTACERKLTRRSICWALGKAGHVIVCVTGTVLPLPI